MTLGIIGRCDSGGLGTLTSEVFRHLRPERTLLLHMGGAGRGDGNPAAYDAEGRTQVVYPAEFGGKLAARAIDWLCAEGIDTLWSAETFYDDEVLLRAHQNGIRTVCYAMPELNPWNVGAGRANVAQPIRPREIILPTAWESGRCPSDVEILPFPIARDRLPWRQRGLTRKGEGERPLHLYHVVGSAMLDRNGTELLLAALPHLREPIRLTLRSEKGLREVFVGNGVTLEQTAEREIDYWRSYPHDADVLVLPRRYGGLSLPIQEAASLGMPTVTLDTDAYANESFVLQVESKPGTRHRMKGGEFEVRDADPRALADSLDYLATHRGMVETLSIAANGWASDRSWYSKLGQEWVTLLR